MCKARSEQFREERILSVVFDRDLGLCVWFGDERIDDGVCGCAPTQGFIDAVKRDFDLFVDNTIGGLGKHPTLRRVLRRYQQGLEKRSETVEGNDADD